MARGVALFAGLLVAIAVPTRAEFITDLGIEYSREATRTVLTDVSQPEISPSAIFLVRIIIISAVLLHSSILLWKLRGKYCAFICQMLLNELFSGGSLFLVLGATSVARDSRWQAWFAFAWCTIVNVLYCCRIVCVLMSQCVIRRTDGIFILSFGAAVTSAIAFSMVPLYLGWYGARGESSIVGLYIFKHLASLSQGDFFFKHVSSTCWPHALLMFA